MTELSEPNQGLAAAGKASLLESTGLRTPARIFVGRTGFAYPTATQLDLRRDHAFAIDAVHAELDLIRDLGEDSVEQFGLFEARSQAESKHRFLMRPDLGRILASGSRDEVLQNCPTAVDFQVV